MKKRAAFLRTAKGWRVKGRLVHPVEAYTITENWIRHFESVFPEKAKRMMEYSKSQDWPKPVHYQNWAEPCIEWLNKRGVRQ